MGCFCYGSLVTLFSFTCHARFTVPLSWQQGNSRGSEIPRNPEFISGSHPCTVWLYSA